MRKVIPGLPGPEVTSRLRAGLIAACLLVLAVALISADARLLMIRNFHVVSAAALLLAAIAVLPARQVLLAPVLAVAAFYALRKITHMKMNATGLPLSWFDIANFLHRPGDLFTALGLGGFSALANWLPLVLLAVAAAVLLLALRRASARVIAVRTGEAVVVLGAGFLALDAAATDIRDRFDLVVPGLRVNMWDSMGQRTVADTVGPFEYLAFTRIAGDGPLSFDTAAPPLPPADLASAVAAYVTPLPPGDRPLPNIVYFHAESTFDPNAIFRLDRRIDLPLWSPGADTQVLSPLHVNVVGGGTWVTEFEILTGVDSRAFGYLGFYSHEAVGPHVRHGFASYLAALGYDTQAYYTDRADYFGVGPAFRNYGFQGFHAAQELGIAEGWHDSDSVVADKVIAAGAFKASPRPRLLFISTAENHGPHDCTHFREGDPLPARFAGNADFAQNCMLAEFLRRTISTSAALAKVEAELRRLEAETGRPWVILVYGDHQPYTFTDGLFSVAGGLANEQPTGSLRAFRKGDNYRETIFQLIGTAPSRLPRRFDRAVPTTLLPTLLSTYLTGDPARLYLPGNLIGYNRCGPDLRGNGCAMAPSVDAWGRSVIFAEGNPFSPGTSPTPASR